MNWPAELPVIWLVDGKRVPGRVAIGVPELVPDGDGEAVCPVTLAGLEGDRITRVHGVGTFHALLQGVHFLQKRLRDSVADGVRVVFPGGRAGPKRDTAWLLEMFKPFPPRPARRGASTRRKPEQARRLRHARGRRMG